MVAAIIHHLPLLLSLFLSSTGGTNSFAATDVVYDKDSEPAAKRRQGRTEIIWSPMSITKPAMVDSDRDYLSHLFPGQKTPPKFLDLASLQKVVGCVSMLRLLRPESGLVETRSVIRAVLSGKARQTLHAQSTNYFFVYPFLPLAATTTLDCQQASLPHCASFCL